MATIVLILGESGTGKSTAMRTLQSAETFLIQVLAKELPFKGWKKNYLPITKENTKGNMIQTDNADSIIRTLDHITEKMPHIKNVVVDDFQYMMANEYMRRAKEKGFEKFTEIGQNAWKVIFQGGQLARPDLVVFFLSHVDTDETGRTRCKTIGKMLNEKVAIEGMFTVVLNTIIQDGQYLFQTQNNGHNTTKSPLGMFDKAEIPNDLNFVAQAIKTYNS